MDFMLDFFILFVVFYAVISITTAQALSFHQLSVTKNFQPWHIPAVFVYFLWVLVFWPKIAYKRFTKQPW